MFEGQTISSSTITHSCCFNRSVCKRGNARSWSADLNIHVLVVPFLGCKDGVVFAMTSGRAKTPPTDALPVGLRLITRLWLAVPSIGPSEAAVQPREGPRRSHGVLAVRGFGIQVPRGRRHRGRRQGSSVDGDVPQGPALMAPGVWCNTSVEASHWPPYSCRSHALDAQGRRDWTLEYLPRFVSP